MRRGAGEWISWDIPGRLAPAVADGSESRGIVGTLAILRYFSSVRYHHPPEDRCSRAAEYFLAGRCGSRCSFLNPPHETPDGPHFFRCRWSADCVGGEPLHAG